MKGHWGLYIYSIYGLFCFSQAVLEVARPPLHHDNQIIDDTSKAEALNAYFSSVFMVDNGSDVSKLRKDLSFQPFII